MLRQGIGFGTQPISSALVVVLVATATGAAERITRAERSL
jgi:hypothetical protein